MRSNDKYALISDPAPLYVLAKCITQSCVQQHHFCFVSLRGSMSYYTECVQ